METKNEADLFFEFFMGLWDEIFSEVALQKLEMPRINRKDNLVEVCEQRYFLVEDGFVEGFWGGKQNVKIPAYIAEVADNLTALAEAYKSMVSKINPQNDNENIFNAVISCDKLVIKSVNFLIENYVLPRMEELKRTIN